MQASSPMLGSRPPPLWHPACRTLGGHLAERTQQCPLPSCPCADEATLALGVPPVPLSWVQLPYFQAFKLGDNGTHPAFKARPARWVPCLLAQSGQKLAACLPASRVSGPHPVWPPVLLCSAQACTSLQRLLRTWSTGCKLVPPAAAGCCSWGPPWRWPQRAPHAQVVRPTELPFPWQPEQALEARQAVLWMLTFQDNHGHLLGEHGPTLHSVLCTYLGRCPPPPSDRAMGSCSQPMLLEHSAGCASSWRSCCAPILHLSLLARPVPASAADQLRPAQH